MLLKLLYPPVCPICDRVLPQRLTDDGIGRICAHCEPTLIRVREPFCMRCGKPLAARGSAREYCEDCTRHAHSFTQGRASFVYSGAVIGTMHRFKYSNRRDYAPVLAREMYRMHGAWIRRIAPDAVIPVPLHAKRRRMRGFNQAALLARQIARLSGIPLEEKLLVRTQNTGRQKELNAHERKNNLKNAFQTTKKIVQLEKVLLIDDIYTTGSTADAAAAALLQAGVNKIYVLCACIGGEDQEG